MLLAVSVDLDEIDQYGLVHGLESPAVGDQVYQRAIPRLVDWARQRGLPLTWFAVGRDLEDAANAEAIRSLSEAGDEIACHSYSHHYDLTRRSAAEMKSEVARGVAVVEATTGQRVAGFRAPGYVVSDTLLGILQEQGLAYDASVFPCPAYYALKAAAIARLAAKGRVSRSLVDVPEVLRAPTTPYRVGRPYWFRGSGIWEIPVQVTRRARLPFIGTSVTLAGALGARVLASGVVGEAFVNLELHGLDALDVRDGLEQLGAHQPDLRIPWPKKLDALDAAVALLRHKGYGLVRMDELAARAASA